MKAPWHLWVVGILSLLWNAMGALDYTMTETRNDAWMKQFTPEQLAYFYGFPAWAVACWALGVWGALAGSVLLLLRSRFALWAFVASLAGITGTSIYQFVLAETPFSQIAGTAALWFSAVIVLAAFLLLWYARRMAVKGVLA